MRLALLFMLCTVAACPPKDEKVGLTIGENGRLAFRARDSAFAEHAQLGVKTLAHISTVGAQGMPDVKAVSSDAKVFEVVEVHEETNASTLERTYEWTVRTHRAGQAELVLETADGQIYEALSLSVK